MAVVVRGFESLRDLPGLIEQQYAARARRQIIALDQFPSRGQTPPRFFKVDGHDVLVIQCGEDFSFAQKARLGVVASNPGFAP